MRIQSVSILILGSSALIIGLLIDKLGIFITRIYGGMLWAVAFVTLANLTLNSNLTWLFCITVALKWCENYLLFLIYLIHEIGLIKSLKSTSLIRPHSRHFSQYCHYHVFFQDLFGTSRPFETTIISTFSFNLFSL